jgi:hypothetical protein
MILIAPSHTRGDDVEVDVVEWADPSFQELLGPTASKNRGAHGDKIRKSQGCAQDENER